MAPKSKKKGVHTVYEEHPQVVRNRERRKVQAAKKAARYLKMTKRKRKIGAPEAVTSPDDGANVLETSSHETSVADNGAQDDSDRSLSTTPMPSNSSDEAQGWIHVFDNNWSKKKTKKARTSVQGKQTKVNKREDRKSQKNITETCSTAEDKKSQKNITETCTTAGLNSSPTMFINYSDVEKFIQKHNEEMPSGASFKGTLPFKLVVTEPQTLEPPMTRTSKREKSFIASESEVPKTKRKQTGLEQFKSTDTKIGQVSSKSIPTNYSEDAGLKKDVTEIQGGARKKDFTKKTKENETLTTGKPIKDKKFTQRNLQNVPLKTSPGELTNKKSLLQKKLENFETEKKCLDEQEKLIAPLPPKRIPKNPGLAVSGFIKIVSLKESFESVEEKFLIYSLKNSDKKILQITDKNLFVSIVVFEGTRVICNRRQLPEEYPNLNDLQSSSRTLEDRTIVALNKDAKSDSKQSDKTITDSSNFGRDDFEPHPLTLEDQATLKSDKNVGSDPGHGENVNTSSNLSQNGVEPFPQTFENQTTVKSDQDVRPQIEHHDVITIESSNVRQDEAESCSETLEIQSAVTYYKDVRSDQEQLDKTPANSSNLVQDNVESYPRTSEDKSTITSDKDSRSDSKQHDETSMGLSYLGQDVETYPRPLESHVTVPLDMSVRYDSEKHEEATNDLNNLGQDNGESCPRAIEDKSTITSDQVTRSDSKQHDKTPAGSSNLEQVVVESCIRTSGQSTFVSDKEVRFDPEQHDKTPADSSNLDQDGVESCPQTMEEESTVTSDKDVSADPEKYDEILAESSNLDQDGVEPCPQTLEEESTVTSDKEISADSEKHDETPSESSNLKQDGVESCLQTMEVESTVISDKDVSVDPEKHDRNLADPSNSENFSVRKSSKENSSKLKSLEENIRKVCDNFLKECNSTCESFVEEVLKNLEKKKK